MIELENAISGLQKRGVISSKLKAQSSKLRAAAHSALRLMRATLREIFDEAAYDRFLRRAGLTASGRAYREFQLELAQQKQRRPRCC